MRRLTMTISMLGMAAIIVLMMLFGGAFRSTSREPTEEIVYAAVIDPACDCAFYWWCCATGTTPAPVASGGTCDPAMISQRDALLAERATLQARMDQINAEIAADLEIIRPTLQLMCGEMQQALDLVNQGIAACPNGGRPINMPAFCQLF